MEHSAFEILTICSFVFFAGIIDAIAGGGGLITVPTYLAFGIPPHVTLGTNKLVSCSGTTFSVSRFIHSGLINWKVSVPAIIFSFIGSFIGTKVILLLNPKIVVYLLLIVVPLTLFVTVKVRNFGETHHFSNHENIKGMFWKISLIGFVCGFYDGFYGPGTGTFLILGLTVLLHFNLKNASANAKIINYASNLAATISFVLAGNIDYRVAGFAILASVAGNWFGTGLALKKSVTIIKPVFKFVLVLLLFKCIYDLV
ncbi:TSUP family transporter [bacterium]|nr:TSUP family transporter [bacterium]